MIGELGDAWNYEVFMWFCLLCRKNTTDKYNDSRKVLKLNTTEAGITEHVLIFIEYLINRHLSWNYKLTKKYRVKVLLRWFNLNGHTIGIDEQIRSLELPNKYSTM